MCVNPTDYEKITITIHIRLFMNEIRESYATILDLYYHKDDSAYYPTAILKVLEN